MSNSISLVNYLMTKYRRLLDAVFDDSLGDINTYPGLRNRAVAKTREAEIYGFYYLANN